MNELAIKYHDFEKAKKEIKKFSEQTTTDIELKKVNDSKGASAFVGDFLLGRGLGLKHKVTGEEFNEMTTQVQSCLHSINNTQIKLIKEFGQVYVALEALDKDYIQAIVVSIKATEKASQSIQETQGQINKIVENQRKTLEELKNFKQKLDGYAHLGDIDKLWEYVGDHSTQLTELENQSGEIKNIVQSNINNPNTLIAEAIEQSNAEVKILAKKIKYAYLIAGGAIGFTIFQLIIMLMKVM